MEPMAKSWVWALFTKEQDDDLRLREVSQELRLEILKCFLLASHHNKLNRAVESQLKSVGKAVIVDCHSFP